MITAEVKKYIEQSVLCWLATCDTNGMPNVSPKEMFTCIDEFTLLIAHIASPHSIMNIRSNPNVCVSFVDIFVQKGFKLKGTAEIVEKGSEAFAGLVQPIVHLFSGEFPVKAIIKVSVISVDPIKAPSYFLFPDTTEESQVANAMKTYKVRPASPEQIN